MLYSVYEMNRLAMTPWRAAANATRRMMRAPWNPMGDTVAGRTMAAAAELFESVTRRYGKPEWMIDATLINGHTVAIEEEVVWSDSWCDLLHFRRDPQALVEARGKREDRKVLFVAPMSGHYATLLRGTVETFLPDCEVYITDWQDARMVPVSEGRFDLDDFVAYIRKMIAFLGPEVHVVAVCQPGPPTLSAIALMAEDKDPSRPASMTFMGSPIDTRKSPTAPNILAEEKPFDWFAQNLIHTVPAPNPGALRRVYPGFLQLAGFMNMNLDRHVDAHWNFFNHLVEGDGDSAEKHRVFYDEYLAVMDLSEEFYLQTISDVFQEHKLARGIQEHHGRRVDVSAIEDIALLTVEGERDDISGIGQTQAAHDLCSNLPDELQLDWVQPEVGHYGVFNGRRFREQIAPRMRDFWDEKGGAALKRR
ncbi:MAG: polyhydroxyalkanoate depolymerase [Maricaulis sp.]|jgi:poly(3-hydroxybutyrate) depolymerase|uniref:polyhydroxyalkanoate depolymerase n=1 Tax=Maricaulis sp. TaxID=1486257 RepID=UPI001B2A965C|nr:polyhydroxyalkanoate depolymerase [Maricaulis sp.]MBO6846319.1 polyhydroxyalkanoate depolymerase [Maricaulis sp.]MBO6875804.1 polyhydroxyalkanoate depolymerase [Maricaulis sp.]MDM7984284.1 polyhydroxyalkanoate depolymerase [Maricaulis sp.]